VSERDTAAWRVWEDLSTLVLAHTRRREVAEALGMSFGRVRALRRIAERACTGRELAARIGADPPFVTVVVDDLEARGLVAREPHPSDRRAKIIRVTAAGKRAADKANRILGTPPEGLQALSDEDLATLQRIVGQIGG
jgi:DNA-binding MarR family transcriptional regulator